MTLSFVLSLVGCIPEPSADPAGDPAVVDEVPPEVDEDDEDPTVPTVPPDESDDPLLALAGCTADVVWTEEGAPYSEVRSVYDENGDLVELSVRSNVVAPSRRTMTYGAPHEVEETVTEYDRGGGPAFDATDRWVTTWEDGRIRQVDFDYGDDGELDYQKFVEYDAEGLLAAVRWGYGPEGDIDDETVYTWTPDGAGGWDGVSEGFDPVGLYGTLEHADAEKRIDRYLYTDDRLVEYGWGWSGRSPLGFPAHSDESSSIDGTLTFETSEETVLDADGRPESAIEDRTDLGVSVRREGTWSWSCPDR